MLESALTTDDVQFEVRNADGAFRGVDPSVLVAIVTGGAVVLSHLISGIIQILGPTARQSTIRLVGKNGSIEIPANYDVDGIRRLMEMRRDLDVGDICIVPASGLTP